MNTPYDEFPDLEIVALRKQVQELESKLEQARAVLREHDLLDEKAHISDQESICVKQIAKYKELSDKNIPFQVEDVRNFEVLVKTLLAIRGKAPAPESKAKKKEKTPDIAKLLKIAGSKTFDRE